MSEIHSIHDEVFVSMAVGNESVMAAVSLIAVGLDAEIRNYSTFDKRSFVGARGCQWLKWLVSRRFLTAVKVPVSPNVTPTSLPAL